LYVGRKIFAVSHKINGEDKITFLLRFDVHVRAIKVFVSFSNSGRVSFQRHPEQLKLARFHPLDV
jgi:hypothetical protein